jgi:hypothetical protein
MSCPTRKRLASKKPPNLHRSAKRLGLIADIAPVNPVLHYPMLSIKRTLMSEQNSSDSIVKTDPPVIQPASRQMRLAFNVLLGLILLFAAAIFMMILVKLPGAF